MGDQRRDHAIAVRTPNPRDVGANDRLLVGDDRQHLERGSRKRFGAWPREKVLDHWSALAAGGQRRLLLVLDQDQPEPTEQRLRQRARPHPPRLPDAELLLSSARASG